MKKIFIIEGPEFVGKSTAFGSAIDIPGQKVLSAREPGGTPTAEKVRTILKGEKLDNTSLFFGMWFSRSILIEKIKQAQEDIVVIDRFDLSTAAYQIYYNDRLNLIPLFHQTRRILTEDLTAEFNYILLDANAETVAERKRNAYAQAERQGIDGIDDKIEKAYNNSKKLSSAYKSAYALFNNVGYCEDRKSGMYLDTSDLTQDQVADQVKTFIQSRL